MLTYNDPARSEQRANVVPPTKEEMNQMIEEIELDMPGVAQAGTLEVLQRLIDHYQNLQHFYDVVGGWEGYEKTLRSNKSVSVFLDVVNSALEMEQQKVEANSGELKEPERLKFSDYKQTK